MNVPSGWKAIAKYIAWLVVGALVGGVVAGWVSVRVIRGMPSTSGYCEFNVCSSSGACVDPRPRLRANCDRTGVSSCVNVPCPPEMPFSVLLLFGDVHSSTRMLVDAGIPGLHALLERVRDEEVYPQLALAVTVLAEMVDRRWIWRTHIEYEDWAGLAGVAATVIATPRPYLDGQKEAGAIVAAATLAVRLGESPLGRDIKDSLKEQLMQLVGRPGRLRERLGGDEARANGVIEHILGLLASGSGSLSEAWTS